MNAQPYYRFQNYFLLALVLLFQACQSPKQEVPDQVIPEAKMAQILTEIHLAEARVSKLNLGSSDSNRLIYKRLEGQIFRKYKVDTAIYNRSYTYYSADPDKLERVYRQVTESLERRKKPTKLQ